MVTTKKLRTIAAYRKTCFLFCPVVPSSSKRECSPKKKRGSLLLRTHTEHLPPNPVKNPKQKHFSLIFRQKKHRVPQTILRKWIHFFVAFAFVLGLPPPQPVVGKFPNLRLWTFDRKWATCTRSTMCSWPSNTQQKHTPFRFSPVSPTPSPKTRAVFVGRADFWRADFGVQQKNVYVDLIHMNHSVAKTPKNTKDVSMNFQRILWKQSLLTSFLTIFSL